MKTKVQFTRDFNKKILKGATGYIDGYTTTAGEACAVVVYYDLIALVPLTPSALSSDIGIIVITDNEFYKEHVYEYTNLRTDHEEILDKLDCIIQGT